MCFRAQQQSDSDAHLEESSSPHTHDDKDDEDAVIGPEEVSKLDKQLRITLKDLQDVVFTSRCPRCNDLERGRYASKRSHSDECRLRIYLSYQENDHPKWQAVKHIFTADKDFKEHQVDN